MQNCESLVLSFKSLKYACLDMFFPPNAQMFSVFAVDLLSISVRGIEIGLARSVDDIDGKSAFCGASENQYHGRKRCLKWSS